MVMVRRGSEYGPLGMPAAAACPRVPVRRRLRLRGGGGRQRRTPGQELPPGPVREEPRSGRHITRSPNLRCFTADVQIGDDQANT